MAWRLRTSGSYRLMQLSGSATSRRACAGLLLTQSLPRCYSTAALITVGGVESVTWIEAAPLARKCLKLEDSSCPEDGNSTDCLLRLVLRTLEARGAAEDENVDWDPVTFAFTVPISIFAATFALITIYQAILAAGPGRRKSNRRAIGSWADYTTKEWSWHDLNRITIATTPVLRSKQILEILKARVAKANLKIGPTPETESTRSDSEQPATTRCWSSATPSDSSDSETGSTSSRTGSSSSPPRTVSRSSIQSQAQVAKPEAEAIAADPVSIPTRDRLARRFRVAIQLARLPAMLFVLSLRKIPLIRSAVATGISRKVGSSRQGPEPPAATWLRFLEHIGLQDLSPRDDGIDTATTMADYLPADLLAAPAYAEVGLIVAMAAISGAYSFRNAADAQQSQYPVVVGNEFQFDFRHHPTLGTIGAFSRYGKAQAVHTVGSVLWRQLMWAIEHARGNVCAMQFLTNRTIADPEYHGPTRGTIALISSISPVLRGLQVARLLDHSCSETENPCLRHTCPARIRNDKHKLLWLLVADTPRRLPVIFPVRLSRIASDTLTMLALNSMRWSDPRANNHDSLQFIRAMFIMGPSRLEWTYQTSRAIFPDIVTADDVAWILGLTDTAATQQQLNRAIARFARLGRPGKARDLDLITTASRSELPVGIEPVMQQSQAFLYEFDDFQAWFQSMQPLRQQYFRGLVLLQLQQLDKWLAGARDFSLNFASLWKCRTSILYYSTLALLDAENAISEQVFDTSVLEQPLQGDRWLGLGVARHHGTLQVLDSFLSQFPWLRGRKTHSIPKSDYQKWMPSTVIRRYRRQIACLLGTQERIGHNSRAVCEMFMRLKHIIDASYSHCNSDHLKRDDGDEKLGHGSEQPNLKDEGPSLVPDLTEAKAGDEAASGRPLGNAALSEPEPGKGGPSSTQQAGGDDDGVLEPPLKKPSGLSAECEVEQSSQPEPEPERPEARHDTSNLAAEKAPTTEEAPGPSAKAASRSKPSRSARRAERDMTVLSGIVDDALIWRAILNAMLYSTAPDSSDVLTSGIWGHVVPVI